MPILVTLIHQPASHVKADEAGHARNEELHGNEDCARPHVGAQGEGCVELSRFGGRVTSDVHNPVAEDAVLRSLAVKPIVMPSISSATLGGAAAGTLRELFVHAEQAASLMRPPTR